MRTSNSKFRLVSEVVFTVYPKTFGVNRSAKRKLKNLATSYGFGNGREETLKKIALVRYGMHVGAAHGAQGQNALVNGWGTAEWRNLL